MLQLHDLGTTIHHDTKRLHLQKIVLQRFFKQPVVLCKNWHITHYQHYFQLLALEHQSNMNL